MELLIGIALKTASNHLDHLSPVPADQPFATESTYATHCRRRPGAGIPRGISRHAFSTHKEGRMNTNVGVSFIAQYSQPSEEQLLSEARSGNDRAFAELCGRHKGMLKRRIFRIVRHPEDAEDILQETLLSAWKHLHRFRGTCRFSTWVTRIGINTSLILLRKRRGLLETSSEKLTDSGQKFEMPDLRDPRLDPEQRYIAEQTLLTLWNAMRRLPPTVRAVMDLYYGDEIRVKDAAAILGINESTAKSRMFKGRNRLRRSLKHLIY